MKCASKRRPKRPLSLKYSLRWYYAAVTGIVCVITSCNSHNDGQLHSREYLRYSTLPQNTTYFHLAVLCPHTKKGTKKETAKLKKLHFNMVEDARFVGGTATKVLTKASKFAEFYNMKVRKWRKYNRKQQQHLFKWGRKKKKISRKKVHSNAL